MKRLLVSSACVVIAVRGTAENIESVRRRYIAWVRSTENTDSEECDGDVLSRTIIASTRNETARSLFDALPCISDRELWKFPTGDIELAFHDIMKALLSADRIAVALECASLTVRTASRCKSPTNSSHHR
ncbi:hypothetical protein ACFWAY_36950 [Rhodococcus sp. NPDC059968]|uniref:hypothetical protein n=1 Tax=Rhodococcus sp. NPDC059968 TaxID=3347017 RepID=UPI00366EECDE